MTDVDSLGECEYWVNELKDHVESSTILFLVCSKIDDIDNEEVTKAEGKSFAQKIGAQFYMTSAKENVGINKMFKDVAN